MRIFKQTAEKYGAFLYKQYLNTIKETLESLSTDEGLKDIPWPNNLGEEVIALIYFAFDFGMAYGNETDIRDRIRDGFLDEFRPGGKLAELLESRSDEYGNAIKETSKEEPYERIGKAAANHIGIKNDPLVYLTFGSILGNNYTNVRDIVNINIEHLK
jgi:hypothetical protein